MSKTKYVMSGGLAFSENKDMEKLRKLSLKGWHVRDFKFMGYTLEKGESADYIYSVDYRTVNEEDAEEYFDFFTSSGWTHVTSQGNIHLFRALPGTKPIYSDRETVVEKHDNLGSSLKWFTISIVTIILLLCLGTFISTGALQTTITYIAVILSVIAIPATWTVLTIYKNKWKAEGRIGLVRFMKSLPALFLILGFTIILFITDDSGSIVGILTSMLIGAVALPLAIWCFMSLYYKWKA
ncbi:DUF2812 domain-containing protein [Gracilibacillus oryzae]|uniref:DUF2812 domain-containing protein n=1 Tax=Gracilibacillus oryzae TaxID=1672701 RepID=A0A7C8KUK6_9BACI|nr:DUF2812 domain-containing protein [Gracilibacillus oryzae]KAB8133589.1 DUF2812 domain-containing protein [Gracilibacillus oryzae]